MPKMIRVSYEHNPSIVFEDVDAPRFDTLIEAVNAMVDVPEVDVVNVYHILQAGSSIARESRRGLGNFLCANDAHGAFGEWGKSRGGNVTMISSEQFNGTYLMYQGNPSPVPGIGEVDGTILYHIDGSYYLHPDYRKYTRKLNLI